MRVPIWDRKWGVRCLSRKCKRGVSFTGGIAVPCTRSGKLYESTVGVRRSWGSWKEAGMSTKLSRSAAKGVGAGEGAVECGVTEAGSGAGSPVPIEASRSDGSAGEVGEGEC